MQSADVRNGALLLVEIAEFAERFEGGNAGNARCLRLRLADQPGRERIEQTIGDLVDAQLLQGGLDGKEISGVQDGQR